LKWIFEFTYYIQLCFRISFSAKETQRKENSCTEKYGDKLLAHYAKISIPLRSKEKFLRSIHCRFVSAYFYVQTGMRNAECRTYFKKHACEIIFVFGQQLR
jgi:hypothetical protein